MCAGAHPHLQAEQHKHWWENRKNNLLILNQDMGALDEEKKDTQYPKSLSQGHHVKNSPSSPPNYTLSPTLSSSLLCFFNQAVWGCQVFWDEDSQPCEKLIPCGPSSPRRSSPWEHWWWLSGRWQWVMGWGGRKGKSHGWNDGEWDAFWATPWPADQDRERYGLSPILNRQC